MEPDDRMIVRPEVVGFSDTWATPLIRSWRIVLGLGIAIVLLGVVVLLNLASAATALAVLVGIGLVLEGVAELVHAGRHTVRWPSYVLAGLWIATGVVAIAWPDVTLWALAVVLGVGLIIGGTAQLVFALRMHRELPRWAWWAVLGAISILAGIACLVWPDATVLVLAVIVGLQLLARGFVTIAFALGLRHLATMTTPAVPT